jgi:multisubunit Na+/H+ antiporter MnhB subunit
MAFGLFGFLSWAMLSLPKESSGLFFEAQNSLEQSGVSNPVTAVLLNYRGYDTLLEIAVLLLAIVAVWSLRSTSASDIGWQTSPFLSALLRFVLPLLLLAGGYLLWIGSFAPGGAFQGGALLGGAIVLVILGAMGNRILLRNPVWIRTALWFGLACFIAAALGAMFWEKRLLEYPKDNAGTWILLIETAAMISIGVTLGAMFLGGRPDTERDLPPKEKK